MKRFIKVLLVLLCAILLVGCEETQESPTDMVLTPTPAMEDDTSYELPNMSEVKSSEQPLLYDFIFGCLDWHVPIGRDGIDSDLYILRNVNLPEVLYTDWYPIQAGYTVPPLGSKIETVTLTARQADLYNTLISQVPEDYVLREGDWELIIYAGDAARVFQQFDYEFRGKYEYTEARVPPFLVTGSGWPTEWLRREPYCSAMQNAGIDITDSWFDKFSYRGEYQLLHDDGTQTEEGYSVMCTGVQEFALCDNLGNILHGLSWENVMDTCNALECNVGDLYHYGSWTPELKE